MEAPVQEHLPVADEGLGGQLLEPGHLVFHLELGVLVLPQLVEGQQMDLPDAHPGQQVRQARGGLEAGIEVGDHRDAGDHRPAGGGQSGQVFQDQVVVHPGALLVGLPVEVLHVHQKQVHVGHEPLKHRRGGEAGGFRRHVYPVLVGQIGQLHGEIRLLQGLAPRQGHAPVGFLVEQLVLEHHVHHLLGGVLPAAVERVFHGVGNGHVPVLGLRIGAPLAPQRAPLEEYRGADALPVVDAEFLDVENLALHRGVPPLSFAVIIHDSFEFANNHLKQKNSFFRS